MGIRHTIAFSDHPAANLLRTLYRAPDRMSLPAPRLIIVPFRIVYESVRKVIYVMRRVLWAEPLFKSYCTRYGKRLRTDIFVHWVVGKGEIVLGDDVLMDGKCSLTFANRYTKSPRLTIGDHSGVGNQCSFTIGKAITIGNYCRIASGVTLFDSPGHPMEPLARQRGDSAPDADVKPITIGDNVWIGKSATIFPGVTIGDNSVVAARSAVMNDVPANTFVAGNPARKLGVLPA